MITLHGTIETTLLPEIIDHQIKHKIYTEQIKIMHSSIPVLLLINLIVILAMSYGFSDIVPASAIQICLSLLMFMVVIRGGVYLYYKDKFSSQNLRPFQLSLLIGSACAGALWGLLSILYFPLDNQTYQIFLLMSLIGMASGSAFTFSIYLPGYFAYVPIMLTPITLYFFSLGDKFHLTLGIVSALFLLVLTLFNIKINRNFKETLTLRFENNLLIEQLKEQKEEAERANNAKSKFLAAASHDLRQPLYALGLFTSVLEDTIQYPKVKRVVDQINASVAALTNLFDKLLDISQLDAGVLSVTKQDFSLEDMMKKLANNFTMEAKEKNIELIWPTTFPSVHSEPDLLERILRNYLSNAIKYTQKGQIKIIFDVQDETVFIRIADTGIGMEKAALQNIYEEFYQVSNPERDRQKGLGLGLSIVKRTADLLEHDISVTSTIGKGSTFTIAVSKAKLLNKAVTKPDELLTTPTKTVKKRILIIDDEENIREGLSAMLTLWGYEVISATDLDEAVQQLQANQLVPDIIISDYRLKENKTGAEAINALRTKFNHEIPALLITGDVMPERLIDMKNSNLQVLFKPVPAMKLRSFLRSIE